MRLECPNCAVAYDVPDALLAPGRTVRCVRCARAWVPIAAEPEAVPEPVAPEPQGWFTPEPEREPEQRPSDTVEPEGDLDIPKAAPRPGFAPPAMFDTEPDEPQMDEPEGRRSWAPWLASLLVLAIAAFALVQWRAQIMAAWPPSQRLYALLGLADPPP